MSQRRVIALAALIGATQLWLAHHYFGFLTGDEVEVLGEVFRLATGFRYGTWDVRNTLIADVVVAPLIWIATRLGIASPSALIVIATIPFAVASSLTIVLVQRLAMQWTEDALAANAATLVFALHWIPLGFGSTTYPRVLAMLCIVGAALLVMRAPFVAGALIGVAFADRYSEIVYLIPLLIVARRNAWKVALGALTSIVVTVGVFDWIRWGAPFASLHKFAELTLVERDFASRVKHQSAIWYLAMLPRWCAPTLLPLLWSARRMRNAWWFVLIPLVALSLIAHKEVRYLQGVIPFLAILAGAGFAVWWRSRREIAAALLAISLAWNLWGLRFLGRESRPAVEAARMLGRDSSLRAVAISQPWACGDKLYLTDRVKAIEVGTPPRNLDVILAESDAAILYESDITPQVAASLANARFTRIAEFRAGRARDVIVFRADRSGR